MNNNEKYIELDCPFDFTSRCTMGRCDCKPKSLLAENILDKHSKDYNLARQYGRHHRVLIPAYEAIAAINEALNLNADKMKNLEEENKRLRDGHRTDVRKAYWDGFDKGRAFEKGDVMTVKTSNNYYTKTFTNEQQTD